MRLDSEGGLTMKGLRIIFMLVAVTVFIGSGGYLLYDYLTSSRDVRDLSNLVQIVEENTSAMEAANEIPQGPSVRVQVGKHEPVNPAGQNMKGEQSEVTPIDKDVENPGETQENGESEPPILLTVADSMEDDGAAKAAQENPQQTVTGSNQSKGAIQPEIMPANDNAEDRDGADGLDSENSLPSVIAVANDAAGIAEVVQDYLEHVITSSNQSVDTIRIEIMPVGDTNNQDDGAGQAQRSSVSVRVQVYGGVGSGLSKQAVSEQIELIVEQCIANDETWTVQSEIIDLNVQIEAAPVLPQYEALYERNSDMVGWIKIEGTQVNCPVMQSSEEIEFYLRRNFEKEYSYSGLPYMDDRCDVSEPNNNLLIYGHNMKDGTMFGELPKYESKSFWEQRRTIQFDLINEVRTYEIIGMFRSKQYEEGEEGFRYYEYIDLSELNRFNEYIEQVKRASFVDTGVTANWGDQILTLSTCSYHVDSGTFVLVAKRIT